MATSRDIRKTVDASLKQQPGRDLDYGPAMQRVLAAHFRHQARAGMKRKRRRNTWNYVTKHRGKFNDKPVRVATGMAGRATLVGTRAGARVAGRTTYRLSRASGRAAKRGYQGYRRRVSPKVAGTSSRLVDSAHSAATTANRRGLRLRAQTRTTRRRVAGRIHAHADTLTPTTRHRMPTRARVEHATAHALDPDRRRHRSGVRCAGCGTAFRNPATAARHTCHQAIAREHAAMRRATRHVAGHTTTTTNPTPTPTSSSSTHRVTTQKGTGMAAEPKVHSSVRPSNKSGKHVDLTGWELSTFSEWLDMLYGKAVEANKEANALNAIVENAEGKRRMDPRAVAPLALAVEAMQTTATLFLSAYAESWRLYSNRIEPDADSGRRMANEDEFMS